MRYRVSEIGGERLAAVLGVDRFESLIDKGKGFVPAARL